MKIQSGTSQELYAWLGQFPQLREWLGERQFKSVETFDYFIKNKKFESTVNIPRTSFEDDQYGLFAPMFTNIGRVTKLHPDNLVFSLLKQGFTAPCYDRQPFFSAAHPSFDGDGNAVTYSNLLLPPSGVAAGPAWFLLDIKQAIKPIIFQERLPYEFQSLVSDSDEYVFIKDEYVFGVRARVNVGFGLWQTAFGSTAPLTPDNYAAARIAMQMLRGDQGGLLGIDPNLLVVPPQLEADARTLLKATSVGGLETVGAAQLAVPVTNIWHDSADLLVTPFVA